MKSLRTFGIVFLAIIFCVTLFSLNTHAQVRSTPVTIVNTPLPTLLVDPQRAVITVQSFPAPGPEGFSSVVLALPFQAVLEEVSAICSINTHGPCAEAPVPGVLEVGSAEPSVIPTGVSITAHHGDLSLTTLSNQFLVGPFPLQNTFDYATHQSCYMQLNPTVLNYPIGDHLYLYLSFERQFSDTIAMCSVTAVVRYTQ